MTTATVAPEAHRTRSPFLADERLLRRRRVGPADRLPIGDVLALLSPGASVSIQVVS